MNIFVLDKDPVLAAQYQCDKHVVKMPLESAQMLCSVAYRFGQPAKYKPTHPRHPCTIWAGDSVGNWFWLYDHAIALCDEYKFRYGKQHASRLVIEALQPPPILVTRLTDFPQAMPDEYRCNDPVEAYRAYYRAEKRRFANWTNRNVPQWFKATDENLH
jgi:hypothetical protein